MKLLIYAIIFTSIITSCKSDDDVTLADEDYLIFGHFYGFCFGEGCVETFKLTGTALFEDTKDDYAGIEFDFIKLPDAKFEQVNDITSYFPDKLLEETEAILGCPDCADGGGLFIQLSDKGQIKSWRIDQMKQGVPEYLHDFMDKVNEKIGMLNEQ